MPEQPTVKRATLDVIWSVVVGSAKVAAVLLGLLVTWNLILAPKFGSGVTETAEEATMWSDLHNLAYAQDVYFADSGSFGASLHELNFQASRGVTIDMTLGADSAWSALASHTDVTMRCAMFIGSIKPPLPAIQEGKAVCRE